MMRRERGARGRPEEKRKRKQPAGVPRISAEQQVCADRGSCHAAGKGGLPGCKREGEQGAELPLVTVSQGAHIPERSVPLGVSTRGGRDALEEVTQEKTERKGRGKSAPT